MKPKEERDVTIKTGPVIIVSVFRYFALLAIACGAVAFLDKIGRGWPDTILMVMLFYLMEKHLGSYEANQWLARRWKWLRQEKPVRS